MPPRPANDEERSLGQRPDFESWVGEITETLDARRDRAARMTAETPPASRSRRGSLLAGLRRLLTAR